MVDFPPLDDLKIFGIAVEHFPDGGIAFFPHIRFVLADGLEHFARIRIFVFPLALAVGTEAAVLGEINENAGQFFVAQCLGQSRKAQTKNIFLVPLRPLQNVLPELFQAKTSDPFQTMRAAAQPTAHSPRRTARQSERRARLRIFRLIKNTHAQIENAYGFPVFVALHGATAHGCDADVQSDAIFHIFLLS